MTAEPRRRGWAVDLWPEEEAHRPSDGPRVELWQDAGGFWEWAYLGSQNGTRLPSNRRYLTREEALDSARLAYPVVPVHEVTLPARVTRRRRLWPWLLGFAALALIGLVAILLVGIVVGAVVVFRRRLPRRGGASPRR